MLNEKLKSVKNLFNSKKGAYLLLCLGVAGMLMIAFGGREKESKQQADENTLTGEQYCAQIEQKLEGIVKAITGDKKPCVTVTLDTGVKYIYADETKTDSENLRDGADGEGKLQTSDSVQNSHVIIEDSSGSQQALLVTEYMPTVRGVTVICAGGEYEDISNKVKGAVMTALDITSKRVFVTGK